MTSFYSKVISNQPTLGETLVQRRTELGLSLEEIATASNISIRYLQALESGNYRQIPGEVYTRSFLKTYAKLLGLNFQDLIAVYETEKKIYAKTKTDIKDFRKPVIRVSQLHLVVTPKIVRGVIVGILALACLVYLGLKINRIMTPPQLIIESPQDNLITKQSFVAVKGKVEKESTLEINGQKVLADSNGNFYETIDLQPGVNTIEIMAEKRHGQKTKIFKQVVVENNNTNN
jgi:cytoskeletal protein RodZ